MSTWLITGCSTGLGRALAEAVIAAGHNAVVTARDAGKVADLADPATDRVLALPLDVTQPDQVTSVVNQAEQKFGGVDVLVNNAGHGYRAAVEEGDDSDVRALFETLGISVTVVEPGAFRTDFAGRSLTQSSTVIDDYADTAGKRRKEHDTAHGTQPGDPAKAAQAILTAAESAEPPAFLLLGTDALTTYRRLAAARLDAIKAWEHLTTSTDIGVSAGGS